MNKNKISLIPGKRILSGILFIRGKKVMTDRDLAELYRVETRVLIQSVKRNIERFPPDFMFQLTKEEFRNLKFYFGTSNLTSQIVISSHGGTRKLPYVFTEQGVAMLSSVLGSKRAIMVNIQIIRTFTQLRELLATNTKLRIKIENMEKKYDSRLREVFDLLKQLLMKEKEPKNKIGFKN
ncbi:MAG: ORF6N domain-containing protein [bacterium]|nr:ORF6N domain-containing protein [bacterium]